MNRSLVLDLITFVLWAPCAVLGALLLEPTVDRIRESWLLAPTMVLACVACIGGAIVVREGLFRLHDLAMAHSLIRPPTTVDPKPMEDLYARVLRAAGEAQIHPLSPSGVREIRETLVLDFHSQLSALLHQWTDESPDVPRRGQLPSIDLQSPVFVIRYMRDGGAIALRTSGSSRLGRAGKEASDLFNGNYARMPLPCLT